MAWTPIGRGMQLATTGAAKNAAPAASGSGMQMAQPSPSAVWGGGQPSAMGGWASPYAGPARPVTAPRTPDPRMVDALQRGVFSRGANKYIMTQEGGNSKATGIIQERGGKTVADVVAGRFPSLTGGRGANVAALRLQEAAKALQKAGLGNDYLYGTGGYGNHVGVSRREFPMYAATAARQWANPKFFQTPSAAYKRELKKLHSILADPKNDEYAVSRQWQRVIRQRPKEQDETMGHLMGMAGVFGPAIGAAIMPSLPGWAQLLAKGVGGASAVKNLATGSLKDRVSTGMGILQGFL